MLYRYFDEKTPLRLKSVKEMDGKLIKEGVIHRGKERRAADKKIGGHRYLELRRSDLAVSADKTP